MSVSSRSSSISQPQYANYPYQQDAVRVIAQHNPDEGHDQQRRFSVDPQLTNFDILKNLVGRAFDMKGDFAISYRAVDDYGGEAYLPMVSDWDLSAAFLSASEPELQLIVEKKNVPLDVEDGSGDYDEEQWDMIKTGEMISAGGASPSSDSQDGKSHYSNKTDCNNTSGVSSQSSLSMMSRVSSAVSYTNQQYPLSSFNTKINTAGLFNAMEKLVQKAKNLYDDLSVVTSRPPLSDVEFRNYLDHGGTLCRPRELRFACYHGGIEPSLRKVVWKHLLNVYPDGLTGNQRMDYIRNKSKDYYEIRDEWRTAFQNGEINEEVMYVSNMVRKDVLRTDRHLKFFAGQDDNQNIASLFNILTTYALNHPTLGYCQGMSDLASPLLYTMGDEAQAYICFCSLMDRIKPNFNTDGLAMSVKFAHLAEGLAYYDLPFWLYLKSVGADDLLFCYRWLLLELKREFAFDDALRMMEVMWASLPYKPQDVPLYEVKYTHLNSHAIPIPVPSLTSSYSKVCAIRRSSTALNAVDIRQRRYSNKKQKGNNGNLSLDENTLSTSVSSTPTAKSHRKPFYSLDESTELVSSNEILSTSPFEILSPEASQEIPKPKLIRNLKEFWQIGRPKSFSSAADFSPKSSLSLKSSTASSTYESLKNVAISSSDADLNGQVFLDDSSTRSDEGTTPTEQAGSFNDSIKSFKSRIASFDKNLSRSLDRHLSATNNDPSYFMSSASSNEILTSNRNTSPKTSNLHKEASEGDVFLDSRSHASSYNGDDVSPTSASTITSKNVTLPKNNVVETTGQNSENMCSRRTNKSGIEGMSQGIESEPDSGLVTCNSESFENSVEPEFQTGATRQPPKMPSPETLGSGNPFLMFLSLTLLLQHRDHIMKNGMDYNETAMYFDKMIRKHNVGRVLTHARQMYSNYLKQNVSHA